MVPFIELRGAVPIGLSSWLGDPLPIIPLYATCIIANMLPVPVIFFFARKVLIWGKDKKYIGKFFTWCYEKGESGGQKLLHKAKEKQKKGKNGKDNESVRDFFVYFALFLFVGIPLPGTGAWTGTLAASFLDLDFKKSIAAVMAGVVCAGIIMGLASAGIFGATGAVFGK
jgi:uncharacterized membrane protein